MTGPGHPCNCGALGPVTLDGFLPQLLLPANTSISRNDAKNSRRQAVVFGGLFQCKICAIGGGEELGTRSGVCEKAPVDFNEIRGGRLDDGVDSILADFAVTMSLGIVDGYAGREAEIIGVLAVAASWRRLVIIMDVTLT
jgi:hypothetical protein